MVYGVGYVSLVVVAFSPPARILGECSTNSFPTCAFFFFKVEISSCTLIPLFRPGSVHSGSVSWDDCDLVFPDELRVSWFPDRFPHYAWIIGSKMYACIGVTCHLHFWQNDRGLLHASAVTQGGTDTEWEPGQKVNSGEEHSPAAPAGIWTWNLLITSPALYQQEAIPAPQIPP